jgi:TfoX/Sxy family transcriptional regulator of competence genes
MPYNENIDKRIVPLLARWKDIDHRSMFGGVCYLLKGNMLCGVYRDYLILRLGEEPSRVALGKKFVKPFDITGKAMKGWVMVEQGGFATEAELSDWLEQAYAFVKTLPPKSR